MEYFLRARRRKTKLAGTMAGPAQLLAHYAARSSIARGFDNLLSEPRRDW